MNMLKTVLKNDVFPALGCTEPIAIAYAAALAGRQLEGALTDILITVDPGVYKNGFAVTIPNTGGERGNLIAGVLGALIQRPEMKMEQLSGVTDEILFQAKAILAGNKAHIVCDRSKNSLYIEVFLQAGKETARAVLEGTHTNLVLLEHDHQEIRHADEKGASADSEMFRKLLANMTLSQFVPLIEDMDREDCQYIKSGIDMNLRISKEGLKLRKVSHYVAELIVRKYRQEDVFSFCEVMTTAAADARMAGLSLPVMSSGGSGNQGIVAILVPHLVGIHHHVGEATIIRSIGLSHLVNSYIKCFTGDLSPLCGCAIAAGVGAAVALVYQRAGNNQDKINLAVNNLISDLGGMLCDGAKEGCALKVATSTNSAIRSAHMALNNHGITQQEGFVGCSAEETIRNLSRISTYGMSLADDTMLGIMMDKMSIRKA